MAPRGLHGLRRAADPGGDLLVPEAVHREPNDLTFAGRESDEAGVQLLGREDRASRGHGPDLLHERGQRHGLSEEACGTVASGRGDVLRCLERRDHEHGRPNPGLAFGEGLDPVPILEPDVEEHDVDIVAHEHLARLGDRRAVGDLGQGLGKTYLKTEADGEAPERLLALPDCG